MAANFFIDEFETNAVKGVETAKECSDLVREIANKVSEAENCLSQACTLSIQLSAQAGSVPVPEHQVPGDLAEAQRLSQKKIKLSSAVIDAYAKNHECFWINQRYLETLNHSILNKIDWCSRTMSEKAEEYANCNADFVRNADIMSNVGIPVFDMLPDEMLVFILSMIGDPRVKCVCRRFGYLYDQGKNRRRINRYMYTKPLTVRVALPTRFRMCPVTADQIEHVSRSGIEFSAGNNKLTVGIFTYNQHILRICVGMSLVVCCMEFGKLVIDLENQDLFLLDKFNDVLSCDAPSHFQALDVDTDNLIFWEGVGVGVCALVACAPTGELLFKTESVDFDKPHHCDVGFGRIVATFRKKLSNGTIVHVHVVFCSSTGKKLSQTESNDGVAYNCVFGVVVESLCSRWYIIGRKITKVAKDDMHLWCIDEDGDMIVSEYSNMSSIYAGDSKVYMVY